MRQEELCREAKALAVERGQVFTEDEVVILVQSVVVLGKSLLVEVLSTGVISGPCKLVN